MGGQLAMMWTTVAEWQTTGPLPYEPGHCPTSEAYYYCDVDLPYALMTPVRSTERGRWGARPAPSP